MLQAVAGFALFFASGYAASKAFFPEAGPIERAAYSLFLALSVPAALLAFLNVFLGVPFTAFNVFAVLAVFCVACFAKFFSSRRTTNSTSSKPS